MKKLVLTLLLGSVLAQAPVKQAYMIWDTTCIEKVSITKNTFLFAPMKEDGTPDKKNIKAHGFLVDYNPNCGTISLKTSEELQ